MITTASCGLIYGAINTTKTTNLGRIARYLYETFGLTSRMITADNEYDTVKDLQEAGVIDVFAIKALPNPFGVLTKLSQGFWPSSVNGRLRMLPTSADRMSKIGAYLIEGTTTIAELCHEDHIRKGRAIGEDVVGKFTDAVDTGDGVEQITFAKSARAHYQQVQDLVTMDLIPTFSMLPVKWIWWTGHEYAGEDEATGQTRLGPGVVGKAAVMRVPRVVGNTFHTVAAEVVATDARTHKTTRTVDRRAYFEPHADAYMRTNMWPAGIKIPVDQVAEWQRLFPDGYIPLTLASGIEQYVAFHHEIGKRRSKLSLTPGTEVYQGAKTSGEVSASAPISSPAPVPITQAAQTSQTKPPVRPYRPPAAGQPIRRPGAVMGRPAMSPPVPQPSLADQLTKSIEHVTGAPVPVELPDINAVPVSTTSEEPK